ncbi:MAG: class I SAM-dependent methyltransferase [bacterium]|nr:class I SAM-dependent methyltransferase [bacterium]
MAQKNAWEKEYQNPSLIKLSDEPRKDLKEYMKFLRRKEDVALENLNILDLGSGNGKNSNYLAELGNKVIGFEISPTALGLARSKSRDVGVDVNYIQADISAPYSLENESIDLVVDIMSSNSLNESEREIYLKEVYRVLKSDGHFFVRGLCKDGDQNAKNLIKLSPGKEYDTYINKDMNLTERVFSRADFISMYSKYFEIQQLTIKTNYAKFKGQNYKRNYWLAYMKKV